MLEIREGDAVSIKQIEVAIINRAFDEGWIVPRPPAVETGRTVAVVGAGPAGLAAAQQLRRAGHAVTVYERDEAGGGLIRFGVPDFKIEKWVVERRLEQLAAEGVEFRYGVDVGVDVDAGAAARRPRRGRDRHRLARAAQPAGARAASSTACTSRWSTSTTARGCSRAAPSRRPHHGRRQARPRRRRRRHRRRLRRALAPRGRRVGDADRAARRAAASRGPTTSRRGRAGP